MKLTIRLYVLRIIFDFTVEVMRGLSFALDIPQNRADDLFV